MCWHPNCFLSSHRVFIGNCTDHILRGNDMSDEIKIENQTRRSAIKTAAQVAITAPAVGLLLSASTKAASAATTIYQGDDGVAKDDFILNDDTITLGDDTTKGHAH